MNDRSVKLTCFKTYDVRGKVGAELDDGIARRIGRAFAEALTAKTVALGSDPRLSSPGLKAAMAQGLQDAGCDVIDLGLSGTEEIYFASFHLDVDGGIEITASHNPADNNGMKFIGRGGRPLTADEFSRVRELAESNSFASAPQRGWRRQQSLLTPYVDHLLSCIDVASLPRMKIVADAGNGAAGHVIDEIERRFAALHVPISFVKTNHEPDGNFPLGVPNPLIPEKRAHTSRIVRESGADLGMAWDGDFDRCFFFDAQGNFVSGYYIAGLLTSLFLMRNPREKIAVDSRLNWNTLDIIETSGGTGYLTKTGHSFFKATMRREGAAYGGEVSAHHYFRDFACCDSGMLPWLMLVEYLGKTGQSLGGAVATRIAKFPSSDEINFKVENVPEAIVRVREAYLGRAIHADSTDGLSMDLADARFNLRGSNTEPLLRLNVEARDDQALVDSMIEELSGIIAKPAVD
jgi:phosphomannomutase